MNRENMVNILEKVSDKSDLCYISSKTKYSLELAYAIKYNEKFLMVADTCDYEYDGYIIIKWENIEDYIKDCPVAEEIYFCRTWAEEIKGSKRELAATLYSYALRQLKYPDTNKNIALELLNASRRIIDNS